MTETSHARSRRAALAGLVLQIIAAVAAFALGFAMRSAAMEMLSLYLVGGIPIWFIALLVFRQHELADLEAMDLEELRREKEATGGAEAIFDERGSGGLGFMVAKTRLEWMRRWLIPVFGLLTAAYLIAAALVAWFYLGGRGAGNWPPLNGDVVAIGMVIAAVLMLLLFFFARYASGMARVATWQLLRGCGSYMLGNSVLAMAIIVVLGALLARYQGAVAWERVVAYAIPILMAVLGVETLLNFLLDIYRPRTPGTEPRACFDSRLLGLIAEPGGIAHSLAEAINYQFGFQVSQTWFYQLLQRTLVPLAGAGVVAVWLLSCIVVVQPREHAIIERWGRQIAPESPLEAGLHFKWPAPIELVRLYNTDQLHEFYVGFRVGSQPDVKKRDLDKVELWTDAEHAGRKHFDFIISPTPSPEGSTGESRPGGPEEGGETGADERAAQHLVRMQVVVQYKIKPDELVDFTTHAEDPHGALYKIAWNEVSRFGASSHIDQLMGELRNVGGALLRERIARRAAELGLGVDIKFVGILQVHPEKSVAESFRGVVTAQQDMIASIREARVTENEVLSRVAGDKRKALALAHASEQVGRHQTRLSELDLLLRGRAVDADPLEDGSFDDLRPQMFRRLDVQWRLELDSQELERIRGDFELGLGGSLRGQTRVAQAIEVDRAKLGEAEAAWAEAVEPVRVKLLEVYDGQVVAELLERAETQVALEFWNERLEEYLNGLEGEAAVTLAQARAKRWGEEMRATAEVALLQNERHVFAAAPEIYKARSYLQALVKGIKDARKYLLAFEPGDRKVHVRIEAQEQAQPDITDMPTNLAQ